jgi:PAT family beta-lactamase induction signal transducer AmpG
MQKSWKDSFKIYATKKGLTLLILGFASGLPLWLYFGTLSIWLKEAGVSNSSIGFFSLVGICYSFKWVWSPLPDRFHLPFLTKALGRRRGWILLTQLGVIAGLIGMALTDPTINLMQMAVFSVVMAFFSATQDIVIDAYRIEVGAKEDQAGLAATYMVGYRVSQILAGAGCLVVASLFDPNTDPTVYNYEPWRIAYFTMALAMVLGVITVLLIKEPKKEINETALPKQLTRVEESVSKTLYKIMLWIYHAFIAPFVDFISRYKTQAIVILLLVSTYRISDIVLGVMAYPFYTDLGFTKLEIAGLSKTYGVIMTLVGATLGGVFVIRYGLFRILFLGALLSTGTNILFALMSDVGHSLPFLTLVISADNFSGGLASAAFIAYLSGLTNRAYSATQYALFSSMMLLFPKFLGGYSGVLVDIMGYKTFFLFTVIIGLPVLLLIVLAFKMGPAKAIEHLDTPKTS